MSQQQWDYIAKIVSCGDSGSGKTSLSIRLCEGRFVSTHDVTIGVEFGSRIVPVGPPASLSLGINDPAGAPSSASQVADAGDRNQKHMKLSIWDTAGQETYKSITRSFFRGASGALLVFDITRRSTFTAVTSWLHDLKQIADEGLVIILVGNKSDLAVSDPSSGLEDRRQVSEEEALNWCKQNNIMKYVETSAKSGEGVERAFLEVAERIHQNINAGKYDLNDRRSGVKSATSGGVNSSKSINLKANIGNASDGKEKGSKCC